jgi:Family of unknown function (DUF5681)
MRREFRFTSEFHALGLRVGAPPLGALLVRRRSSNEMAAITQKMHARHWPKGTSGNPKGKPVGRKANATLAAEVILDGEDEALTRKAVDLALAGDTFALKLVLDGIIPPRRTRRIELDMRCCRRFGPRARDDCNHPSDGGRQASARRSSSDGWSHRFWWRAYERRDGDRGQVMSILNNLNARLAKQVTNTADSWAALRWEIRNDAPLIPGSPRHLSAILASVCTPGRYPRSRSAPLARPVLVSLEKGLVSERASSLPSPRFLKTGWARAKA